MTADILTCTATNYDFLLFPCKKHLKENSEDEGLGIRDGGFEGLRKVCSDRRICGPRLLVLVSSSGEGLA